MLELRLVRPTASPGLPQTGGDLTGAFAVGLLLLVLGAALLLGGRRRLLR